MTGARPRPLPVLMYHSVSDRTDAPFADLTLPARVLDEQLGHLRATGCALVGVSEALDGFATGRFGEGDRVVALTFDDAYADFVTAAWPVLQRWGAGATLYVPTRFVGGPAAWLEDRAAARTPIASWLQLAEVTADPQVEIGSHGHGHLMLDAERLADAGADLAVSKRLLEDRLGVWVRSFCYPYGFHRPAVDRAVRDAGYTSACETGQGVHDLTRSPFAVRRLTVDRDTTPAVLDELLAGRRPPRLAWLRRHLAVPAYRWYRTATVRTLGRPGPAPRRVRYWLG